MNGGSKYIRWCGFLFLTGFPGFWYFSSHLYPLLSDALCELKMSSVLDKFESLCSIIFRMCSMMCFGWSDLCSMMWMVVYWWVFVNPTSLHYENWILQTPILWSTSVAWHIHWCPLGWKKATLLFLKPVINILVPVLYTVALYTTFWNMNSAIWAVGQ